MIILLASFGLVLGIGFVVIKVAPGELASKVPEKDHAVELDRVRTQALAVFAGAIAAAGAVFTGLSYLLSRSGQVTERFTKAIEQLGDADNPLVRLGGIYALERIAHDSRRDHPRVMELLTAYARRPPQCRDGEQGPIAERPQNVQAALAVLKRRKHWYDENRLDLRALELSGAMFPDADLRGAILENAIIPNADLHGANLRKRRFPKEKAKRANLTGAHLNGANLEGTDLRGAVLKRADLTGAHLKGADLRGAHLEGVGLTAADLEGTRLRGAFADAKTQPKELWDELKKRHVKGVP